MVYQLIFLVGAISLVTTLLDIFLSDNQKTRLSELSVRVWNWVDEAKGGSMLARLSSPRSQKWIINTTFWIVFLVYLLSILAKLPENINQGADVAERVGIIVGNILGFLFILWLLRLLIKRLFARILDYLALSRSIWGYIGKLTLVNLAMSLILSSAGPLLNISSGLSTLLIIILIPLILVWGPFFILSFIVYVIAALIILAYLLLYPLELFLRRIAEYPKGPILALSTLATAIGAFARFLLP